MNKQFVIEEISAEEYTSYMKKASVVYSNADFYKLNADKAEYIVYLAVKKGSIPRFRVSFGIKDSVAKCPFSAPFDGMEILKNNTTLDRYEEAVDSVLSYAVNKRWKKIQITLPPLFYNKQELSGWVNILFQKGFSVASINVNHALNLKKMYSENYMQKIQYNARKNIKLALKSELVLRECKNEEEKIEAYDIIAANRASRGYPLRMSCQQVMDTIKIIDHEMFLVQDAGDSIAAALVFHSANNIAQVIYWGDRPGFRDVKPMNFLAYELVQFYGENGYRYLDIGPSTENSVPNYGLCDFKESIGCERDLKFTFEKEIF